MCNLIKNTSLLETGIWAKLVCGGTIRARSSDRAATPEGGRSGDAAAGGERDGRGGQRAAHQNGPGPQPLGETPHDGSLRLRPAVPDHGVDGGFRQPNYHNTINAA